MRLSYMCMAENRFDDQINILNKQLEETRRYIVTESVVYLCLWRTIQGDQITRSLYNLAKTGTLCIGNASGRT